MGIKAVFTFNKQRKRGSWRSKHRSGTSRWLENILKYKNRKVFKKTKMYDSVKECLENEQ